jgi:hypothetical protein
MLIEILSTTGANYIAELNNLTDNAVVSLPARVRYCGQSHPADLFSIHLRNDQKHDLVRCPSPSDLGFLPTSEGLIDLNQPA